MRHHINVLYGAVMLLLILQIIFMFFVSSQTARIIIQQEELKKEFKQDLYDTKRENQYAIGQIVNSLSDQQTDFETQMNQIKSEQQDFSSVIEDAVKKVVTVATESSGGTGFLVGEEGYIVTNYHVVAESTFINVLTYDKGTIEAELVGFDPTTDVALLKAQGRFDKFQLINSNEAIVGEKVIAIGNPLGLSFTVTEGIVSATKRTGPNGLEAYVQTDVTLNPGNSGGPLINKEGKVVGVNNFKVGGAEGLGFALESNIIREVVNGILNRTLIE